MTLPSAGQLRLSQINQELGNGATDVAKMRTMSVFAQKTTPDKVSDFHGYTQYPRITVTNVVNLNPYKSCQFLRTFIEPGSIITCNFDCYAVVPDIGLTVSWYFSNSHTVWPAAQVTAGAFQSGTTQTYAWTGIAATDLLFVRVGMSGFNTPNTLTGNTTLTSVNVTTGSYPYTRVFPYVLNYTYTLP